MTTKTATRDLDVARRQITAVAKVAPTSADVAAFLELMGGSTHTAQPATRIGCTTDQEG